MVTGVETGYRAGTTPTRRWCAVGGVGQYGNAVRVRDAAWERRQGGGQS
jgi:hypothetical protein